MIIFIMGASHTGKTALAQTHHVNYILIEDNYKRELDGAVRTRSAEGNQHGSGGSFHEYCTDIL